jgi:cob(I)alamin adenosyltransferase
MSMAACLVFVALQVGIFLNRLSDYLFTAARFAVSIKGFKLSPLLSHAA